MFNSDGWKTTTTKDRLNRFCPLPYSITQDNGNWYITQDDWQGPRLCVFKDGMVITASGKITHAGKIGTEDKRILAIRRKVAKYAKAFVTALEAGKVPQPSDGDCWYCCLRVTSPEKDKDKALGEVLGDPSDHILNHMKQSYFVPSLLIRAMEKAGVGPGYFWNLQAHWEGKRPLSKWEVKQFACWIRRYCYAQLGLVR